MTDITWKVSGITYCGGSGSGGWVHVSPTAGTGDESSTLTISVDQSFNGPHDCSAATVVISASTGDIQEIPVTRCLRECDCKSMKIEQVDAHIVDDTGETGVNIGEYDKNCFCASPNILKLSGDDTVIINEWIDDGKIYVDVDQNCGKERTGFCEVFINGYSCKTLYVKQQEVTYTWVKGDTRTEIIKVTAEAETSIDFGCSGGPYSAKGTKEYKEVTEYKCYDACGGRHPDKDYEESGDTKIGSLGSTGGTFSNRECDCETAYTKSVEIQFEADEIYSNVITFTQTCSACPDESKCSTECYYTIGGGGESEGCDDKNISFTKEKHTS